MDNLTYLKSLADDSIDLIIADPEYGFGVNMNMGRRKGKAKKHEDKDWDSKPPSEDYFNELFRVSKNQIIWGGNYFGLPPNKCFIIWDKGETIYGRDFAECEYAWASFDESSRIFKMNPNQSDRIHPTQKPIALYKWILKHYSKQSDTFLDPNLGSGSSRIAAFEMGIAFFGLEKDKDYFDASVKRFEQYKSQLKLFV